MDFAKEKNPLNGAAGFGFVIALHVLIVYALMSGLAHQMVEVIKGPMETKVIKEDKVIPDDQPPPPPPPKLAAPPPPFIPPPEINVQQQQSPNTIVAVQREVVAPPPPREVAVVAPPAPPSVRVAAGVDPNKYCPRKPDYPSLSKRNSEEGTVVLEFLIGADGAVKDSKVVTSSGHARLDEAARSGLSAYCKFKPATVDGKPEETWQQLKYTWRLED